MDCGYPSVSDPVAADRLHVALCTPGGQHWSLRAKPSAVSVAIDTDTVYTFDREGRPWSALVDGVHYRRGLDGRVRARALPEAGGWKRWLPPEAAEALWEGVRDRLAALDRHLGAAGAPAAHAAGRAWLARLLAWDRARRAADAAAFARLYTSVPILPPDQYNALVVQVATGCAWNRCTFCDLYRDRRYHVASVDGLDDHIDRLRAHLGAGLSARRHLFLGDANLLGVPPARLLPLLARVRDGFPEPAFAHWAAFADVVGALRCGGAALRHLAALGLRRVYFGLESGSDAVRQRLGKAGRAADAVRSVAHLHNHGIAAGVILLLGAGGAPLAEAHVRDSAAALAAMALGAEDAVFFSPLRGPAAAERDALDEAHLEAQRQALERSLPPRLGGPRRALYDIDDFVY